MKIKAKVNSVHGTQSDGSDVCVDVLDKTKEAVKGSRFSVTSYANLVTGLNSIARKKVTTVFVVDADLEWMEANKEEIARVVKEDLLEQGRGVFGDVEVSKIKRVQS